MAAIKLVAPVIFKELLSDFPCNGSSEQAFIEENSNVSPKYQQQNYGSESQKRSDVADEEMK